MPKQKQKKRGPKPESLRVEGDWRDAMGKALKKRRPKAGWPREPEKKKPDA